MPVTMATTGRGPIVPTDRAIGPSVSVRRERALVRGASSMGMAQTKATEAGTSVDPATSRPSAGGTPRTRNSW